MKVPTISSSRTSSESWRDRSSAADMAAACVGGDRRGGGAFLACAGAFLVARDEPPPPARFCLRTRFPAAVLGFRGARSAIGGALVEVEDLRRSHVGLGLVARDLADLAHDLGHALGLAQDDVDG